MDVFFVISGYLISTFIFENLDNGTFSFADFYSRRIRRIFPSLILVLSASFAFGWFSLLADEFKQLGKHIAAGAGFISNFILWNEAGYFDNSADTKPLLHLWSLAIEEQFYIVWPILMWSIWKRNINAITVIVAILAASLIYNINISHKDAVADFYSPLTRFWEIASGSLLAYLLIYKRKYVQIVLDKMNPYIEKLLYNNSHIPNKNTSSNLLSLIGLFLLILGLFRVHKSLMFPGSWALLPVIGSLLIIVAGTEAWVNRNILSHKIAVWFGLISYPLYLWHWPPLSFVRIVKGEAPSWHLMGTAVITAMFLSIITFYLAELPIRKKANKYTTILLVFLLTTCGFIGYDIYVRDGLRFRFSYLDENNHQKILKIFDAWKFRFYPYPENSFVDPKTAFLRIGNNENFKILFIGDSHAQQYWNSINDFINSTNVEQRPSILFADLGFPSVLSDEIINDPAIKSYVFSYYWSYKYGSLKVNQAVRCCGAGFTAIGNVSGIAVKSNIEMDNVDSDFTLLLQKLSSHNKKNFIILDNPFGEEVDPHAMLLRSWTGFKLINPPTLLKDLAIDRVEPVRSRITRVAKLGNAEIIDPFKFLCDEKYCPAFSKNGDLLYKYYDHLSLYTSKYETSYLAPIFKNK